MPMADAYIPDGALQPEAERRLISDLTDILIRCEGEDPTNAFTKSVAWVLLHRPTVFVAGKPTAEPHYRFVASVPEGQWDDERRAAMVAAVTDAVLDAEPAGRSRDPGRVWVFPQHVPEGTWDGRGQIFRLADIAGLAFSVA